MSIVEDLQNIFKLIQSFILGDDGHRKDKIERQNPKGGHARGFDLYIEDLIRSYFESRNPQRSIKIISEEQALPMLVGEPPYSYTLIIDPIDGSDNHVHGIQSAAFMVAVIPGHLEVLLDNITHAFVGDIYTGNIFRAERGKGAFWNNKRLPLYNLDANKLEDFYITLNFDRGDLGEVKSNSRCLNLFKIALGNRRSGSAGLDICEVAKGSIGAYVDIRDELSPENFLGPSLILRESGCAVTDEDGNNIGDRDFSDLSRRYNIICAKSDNLVKEILSAINQST